ncbi:hypothetical protein EVAR_65380_1 [Eumeta japonica]|uniref:Uncharacterized protein n=1 Tax=Eumeta variegata TaxID=151549 RepID=A0A4C2A123_EUMVA|nr:hypothetical protein EVAR_65380_1 [Eumeta japonica]
MPNYADSNRRVAALTKTVLYVTCSRSGRLYDVRCSAPPAFHSRGTFARLSARSAPRPAALMFRFSNLVQPLRLSHKRKEATKINAAPSDEQTRFRTPEPSLSIKGETSAAVGASRDYILDNGPVITSCDMHVIVKAAAPLQHTPRLLPPPAKEKF